MTFASKRIWGITLGLSFLLATGAFAYTPLLTQGGKEIKWAESDIPVAYYINVRGTTDIEGDQENEAIRSSFNTWERVETSRLTFSDRGMTETTPDNLFWDGMNVVGFAQDSPFLGLGVLGLTMLSYENDTGNLLEADIVFNDGDFVFSTTRETNITLLLEEMNVGFDGFVNLYDVAVHEIGHLCGLGHSYLDGVLPPEDGTLPELGEIPEDINPLNVATMYPYLLNGSTARSLHRDDEAGLSHLYPTEEFYEENAVLEGRIVSALDPEEAVFGAHVVAVDGNREEVVSFISGPNGNFRIEGIDPGLDYTFLAEPLPFVETASLYYQDADVDFPPEYFDDAFRISQADRVSLVAGLTTGGLTHTVLLGFIGEDQNEPNDSFDEFTEADPDIRLTGVLNSEDADDDDDTPSVPGEVDRDIFRFRALRGSRVRIDVFARRLSTQLEPLLILYDSKGNEIARNEDHFGLMGDARIDFRVPESGFYFVEVADARGQDGPAFFYQLVVEYLEEVQPILPDSELFPAFSFELTSQSVGSNQQLRLKEINLILTDVPPVGDFQLSDLGPIMDDISSGISVFNDTGLSPDVFDYRPAQPNISDRRIPLADGPDAITVTHGLGEIAVRLKFDTSSPLTVLGYVSDGGVDFHVVIRTSNTLHLGDDFKISIPVRGIVLQNNNVSVEDPGRLIRAFDYTIPERQTVLTGELLEMTNLTILDQRIDRNSQPTGVVGINAIGDPEQGYYLDEVTVWVIGYNAKRLAPLFDFVAGVLTTPEIVANATKTYGSFSLANDLKDIVVQDPFRGGGVALYKDEVLPGSATGQGDGVFDPGTDPVVPYGPPTIEELNIKHVPVDFVSPLIPRILSFDLVEVSELLGGDLRDFAGMRAWKVTLPLDEDELALIPGSNVTREETLGPDFFVAVQTGADSRNLDRFMVVIPDEGVRIRNNFGGSSTVDAPSMESIDPAREDLSVNALTVRPRPFVEIEDLTKKSIDSRTLPLPEEGGTPVAVLGVNFTDFGASTHLVPQQAFYNEEGIFFNQGYVWDSFTLDVLPVEDFEDTDLRFITQAGDISNNNTFFSSGIANYLDDDTPIGDFIDNDGDGRIDEELRNGRDDDLDGVIDEPDFGDVDDVGLNGVFDVMDTNDYWPSDQFIRHRYVNFVGDAVYVTAPNFQGNEPAADGSIPANFEMLGRRNGESAGSGVFELIDDPWTFSPQFIFVRTGFTPIWYSESATLSDFSLTPLVGNGFVNGFYITLGDDAEDYQPLIDVELEGRDFEFSYNFAFPIPDEDSSEDFPYLNGNDVFVALRASDTAEPGDTFQIRVPADALGLSVYQSANVGLNNSFPTSAPDGSVTTEEIRIGAQSDAPQIEIIQPAAGRNTFDSQDAYTFEAVIAVTDTDSINVDIDVYIDINNRGFDGLRLTEQSLSLDETINGQFTYRISLSDPEVWEWVESELGVTEIRDLTELDRFYVYVEADDFVNEPVMIYSDGYIVVDTAEPAVEFIAPATTVEFFDEDFAYEVIFDVTAPEDAELAIDVYLDTDNIGEDRVKLTEVPLDDPNWWDGTYHVYFSLRDPDVLDWLQRRLGIVDVQDISPQRLFYVYVEIDDGINDTVKEYAPGALAVEGTDLFVAVIEPRIGRNYFNNDFSFNVTFNVQGPVPEDIEVNLFLDTDNEGLDGIWLNQMPLGADQSGVPQTYSLVEPHIFRQIQDLFELTSLDQLTENNQFFAYAIAQDVFSASATDYSLGYYVMRPDAVDTLAKYVKLNRNGQIYTVGMGEQFRRVPATMDIPAVDLEMLPEETGLLALLGDGRVYGRNLLETNLGAFEPFRRFSFDPIEADRIVFATDVFFGWDVAVDLEMDANAPGYYILTNDGGLHPLGNVRDFNKEENPPPFFNWDIARDFELLRSTMGGYVLDGMGGVHPVGEATQFSQETTWNGGIDSAIDLELTASENGYWVLFKDGVIWTVGEAADLQVSDATMPTDADLGYRDLEQMNAMDAFLVMNSTGTVTPLLEAQIGYDPYTNSGTEFVDLEKTGRTMEGIESIIEEYFDAYAHEDIDRIVNLMTDDYLDLHGNDQDRLEEAFDSIFKTFSIGEPRGTNSFQIMPFTDVVTDATNQSFYILNGDEVLVQANVTFMFRYPVMGTLGEGEDGDGDGDDGEDTIGVLNLEIPFSQTVSIYELEDGRGDELTIYDVDNPTGEWVEGTDEAIYVDTFKEPDFEGPGNVRLNYEGPGEDNSYAFVLVDGGRIINTNPGEADVRVLYYNETRVTSATGFPFFFTLVSDEDGNYRIKDHSLWQVLPPFGGVIDDDDDVADDEEGTAAPIGFSIKELGPVLDFQVTGQRGADFYFGGGDAADDDADPEGIITHASFRGIVNLTQSPLGIQVFDAFNPSDYEDLSDSLFVESADLFEGDIYLIVSLERDRYFLIQPVGVGEALAMDWQFRPEFVVPEAAR